MIAASGFPFEIQPTSQVVLLKLPKKPNRQGQSSGRLKPRHRRIRPVRGPAISLAKEKLLRGRTLLEPQGNLNPHYVLIKRVLDIVGGIALIVAFSPILLVTFAVLCVTTKGRPLFLQQRVGLCGLSFTMIKFRTMRLDAAQLQAQISNEKDGPIFKNRRDPRITRIGRFLRSTSIDEMPQLFNVLAGHMSLVGPRPAVISEVAQYTSWQRRRLAVRPGLTCLWQISGRSEIAFEQWMRMDLWYLRNQGLKTDLGLLIRTPLKVLSRQGAY